MQPEALESVREDRIDEFLYYVFNGIFIMQSTNVQGITRPKRKREKIVPMNQESPTPCMQNANHQLMSGLPTLGLKARLFRRAASSLNRSFLVGSSSVDDEVEKRPCRVCFGGQVC
jgi:hypothetical protein